MRVVEVGQPFHLRPPASGVFPALDEASLAILGFFGNLTSAEVKGWRKGPLRYGLFVHQAIPWICLDAAGFGDFQLVLNIHLEPQDKRDRFLAGEATANAVQMILCDWPTPTVRAIRLIGLVPEIMPAIKAALFDQLVVYPSAPAVARAAAEIEARVSSTQMMDRANMRRL